MSFKVAKICPGRKDLDVTDEKAEVLGGQPPRPRMPAWSDCPASLPSQPKRLPHPAPHSTLPAPLSPAPSVGTLFHLPPKPHTWSWELSLSPPHPPPTGSLPMSSRAALGSQPIGPLPDISPAAPSHGPSRISEG